MTHYDGPTQRLHLIRIAYGLLGIGCLALLGSLFVWSDGPRVRYATMSCQYDVLYGTAGPVDAVVVGTSRAQRGVSIETLATDLGLNPVSVGAVNIARGGRGPGQLYQQLVDLDTERGIDGPIIFEYTPSDMAFWRSKPLYYQYTPNFAVNVPARQFVEDWRSKPREPAYSRLRDLLGQAQVRLDASLQAMLMGSVSRNPDVPLAERPPASAQTCITAAGKVQTAGQRRQMQRRERQVSKQVSAGGSWRDLPPAVDDLGLVNQDRQNYYVGKVIAFARARGVPIAIVVMPGYLEAPPASEVLQDFQRRFGVPLLYPPLAVREQLNDPAFFQDAYHLNSDGSAVFARWLAGQILAARDAA